MVSRFHFIPHLPPTRFIIYSWGYLLKTWARKIFFSRLSSALTIWLPFRSGLSASTPFLGHPNIPEHDRHVSASLVAGLAVWDVLLRYELDYHTKLILAPTAPTQ